MNIERVTRKFAELFAMDEEAMQECLPFCRDAAAAIAARCSAEAAATEPVLAVAAALAYYRRCLAYYSGMAAPTLGQATAVTAETVAAARTLLEQYREAAAPWLGDEKFYFGQVIGCK